MCEGTTCKNFHPLRGLTMVNADVFNFFILLNGVIQHNCTFEHFHIHGHKTFHFCRNSIDSDIELLNSWINLFGGVVDDNIKQDFFSDFSYGTS